MKIYSLLFFVFLQSCSYTIIDETTNSAVEVDGRDDLIGYIYKTKRTLYNKRQSSICIGSQMILIVLC